MTTLLFMGHPGHELLAYKVLKEYRPLVVYLTTGSGNKDNARIHQSVKLVESLGLQVYEPFKPFTDRQVYEYIMHGRFDAFTEAKELIKKLVLEKQVGRIMGDALEGFNPSHDLCRYLINATVKDLEETCWLENYYFLQDQLLLNDDQLTPQDSSFSLTDHELEAKLAACLDYEELKFEVNRFMEKYGTDFFRNEYFKRIQNPDQIVNWESATPFYETHGKKRVAEGVYKEALLFEEHMKPLALHLLKK